MATLMSRGLVSDAAHARQSKFGKLVTREHAEDFRRRPMSPKDRTPLPDLIIMLRDRGDELHAGLNAGESRHRSWRATADTVSPPADLR
jgi:hypothetical protein